MHRNWKNRRSNTVGEVRDINYKPVGRVTPTDRAPASVSVGFLYPSSAVVEIALIL